MLQARVRSYVPALLAGLAAFVVAFLARRGHEVDSKNYVLLADAWLHGHSWIAFTTVMVDAVPFHGRAYVVEGAAPALFLIPLVALFGTNASQAFVANVLGGIAVFATWRLAERTRLPRGATIALCAFAFFGTSLYTCATDGDVWFLAHVSSFAFTLLAISECMGAGRAWLVAIYALLAAFSRFPLLVALPLYATALALRERRARDIVPFLVALVPGFALVAWYDWARWGTLGDPGYTIWYRVMDDRARFDIPMFSLRNVPQQVATFVARFPTFVWHRPYLLVPDNGFSLLCTSLPLAYGVFAGRGTWPVLLGVGTLATAVPAFAYYDTGEFQFGMRHALDFEPFAIVLLMLALARRPSRTVVIASFAFAAFGAFEGTLWLWASSVK